MPSGSSLSWSVVVWTSVALTTRWLRKYSAHTSRGWGAEQNGSAGEGHTKATAAQSTHHQEDFISQTYHAAHRVENKRPVLDKRAFRQVRIRPKSLSDKPTSKDLASSPSLCFNARMRLRAIFKCPFCGGIIPNTSLKIGQPVTCPSCSRLLQPARWQLTLSGVIAVGLTLAGCHILLGLRGVWLAAATLILWFPVLIVSDLIFCRIVPPRLVAYVPESARNLRRRTVRCPMCDKQFSLPSNWADPPFYCPGCHQQLQARFRFQQVLRYLFVIGSIPIWFFAWINGRLLTGFLYALGLFLVSASAGSLSTAIFPLRIEQYQSSVTDLGLMK